MNEKLVNERVMAKIIAKSPLCQHAIRELRLAGYVSEGDSSSAWIYRNAMEAVAVFVSHGNHSMPTAKIEADLVKRLCDMDILSPLTFNDDEWMPISEGGFMQNKRKGSIFKNESGEIYDIDAYTLRPEYTWRYGAKDWERNDKGICWTGELFETDNPHGMRPVLTGWSFRCCAVRYGAKEGYLPKAKITIPCYEIEISPDNWVHAAPKDSASLKQLKEEYDIHWDFNKKLNGVEAVRLTPEHFD